MKKPVIFISHSSKDKAPLAILKDLLQTKTANTLDVFLSSDGQSIPFGRNWVHELEQALKDTSIMFIVVSPNSVYSKWIYFESGFSYAKNVKVIPIGLMGVDLGEVQGPLSLLQGFNVNSHHGLNNMIATINTEYNTSFPENFIEEDFQKIITATDSHSLYPDTVLYDRIDSINLTLDGIRYETDAITAKIDEKKLTEIINALKADGIPLSIYGNYISTHGLTITRDKDLTKGTKLYIAIDPFSYKKNFEILQKIYELIGGKEVDCKFKIHFKSVIKAVIPFFKVTSRLANTKVQIHPEKAKLRYDQIEFQVLKSFNDKDVEIEALIPIEHLSDVELEPLLSLLFEKEVLSEVEEIDAIT